MLGLGLSLLGGAVMETVQGQTAFFPANRVYHKNSSTVLAVEPPGQAGVPKEAWYPSSLRGHFRCSVDYRGSRGSFVSFGQREPVTGAFVTLYLSARPFVINSGNVTHFLYSPKSVSADFTDVASWNGLGDLDFSIKDNHWELNVPGNVQAAEFEPGKLPRDLTAELKTYLFAMSTIRGYFYGSYLVNSGSGMAYQCLPMQSAMGTAALYEITSKQLITDATLQAA